MNVRDRYARGLERLNSLDPNALASVEQAIGAFAPDFPRLMVEFAYGDVHARPGLDVKSRQIATVAALAGLGNAQAQLKFHVGATLAAGASPEEIVEIMYLVAVFAGFPAALNGLFVAGEVFEARGLAVAAAPADNSQASRRERGLAALARTSKQAGESVLAAIGALAPDMPGFLLDFSYGDVIARPLLDPKHKEIVMIAAAAARGTMRPQLIVHVKAALAVGVTKEEISELLLQMAVYAGFPAALNAMDAALEAFKEQG